ncbi:MAG: hypothetical protein KKD63_08735 [Proteobacteria bacterium]|nr:hypothetical protein [Desulfobulbaceae bacterium]MBU4152953.1 hypothetical protein [Pseudomonadota bacterium]
MGISGKIMEALKSGILMNERLSIFIEKVDRMDDDLRNLNSRLIRLETIVEIAKSQPQLEKRG